MLAFANLSAFWWLFALAFAAAAYFFRRRAKKTLVSSLMFFNLPKAPKSAGRSFGVLQPPFILLLEILILVLLVIAAAEPMAIYGEKKLKITLVLDASISVGAVYNGQSAKDRALKYIKAKLLPLDFALFTLIRAADTPEIIGKENMNGAECAHFIKSWACTSPTADIGAALALAREISLPDTKIFVFSDEKSPDELKDSAVWLSFGEPINNLGITAVSRYAFDRRDRCIVEISSFSDSPQGFSAKITNANTKALIKSESGIIKPQASKSLRFFLSEVNDPIKVEIDRDEVTFDNTAFLLPVRKPPLRVKIDSDSAGLISLITKTVKAAETAIITDDEPELIITDKKDIKPHKDAWCLFILTPEAPVSLIGSVVVDKQHPLTRDLPKIKTAWAFDKNLEADGQILMSLQNVPLLCVKERPDMGYNLNLNIDLNYSRLHQTPVWPVLFWNLFNWRLQSRGGLAESNVLCGSSIEINVKDGDGFEVVYPSGRTVKSGLYRGNGSFRASEAGLYTIKSGKNLYKMSANFNSADESDFNSKSTNVPDIRLGAVLSKDVFCDVRWWFMLSALILIIFHLWLLRVKKGGGNVL